MCVSQCVCACVCVIILRISVNNFKIFRVFKTFNVVVMLFDYIMLFMSVPFQNIQDLVCITFIKIIHAFKSNQKLRRYCQQITIVFFFFTIFTLFSTPLQPKWVHVPTVVKAILTQSQDELCHWPAILAESRDGSAAIIKTALAQMVVQIEKGIDLKSFHFLGPLQAQLPSGLKKGQEKHQSQALTSWATKI